MSISELAEWLGLAGENGRTMIREMESGKRQISGPIRRAMWIGLKIVDSGNSRELWP